MNHTKNKFKYINNYTKIKKINLKANTSTTLSGKTNISTHNNHPINVNGTDTQIRRET